MFSTGGDELNIPCYDADAETQQILNSTGQTLEQALSTFTQSTHGALATLGKTPVVWEGALRGDTGHAHGADYAHVEMVLEHNVTLANDTVVMYVLIVYLWEALLIPFAGSGSPQPMQRLWLKRTSELSMAHLTISIL